jgi:hypothetical protein
MAANTNAIFPLTPNTGVQNVLLSTALTNTRAFDGTDALGTAKALIFTAGASGSRVDQLSASFTSTNTATASGTTAATLVRFWLNNGTDSTVATNNQLLPFEISLPATAVTALASSILAQFAINCNLNIPAGYKIYAGITIAIGGTNCAVLPRAWGGDY